ncbi:MAG: WD40 repeat domain-containing protein [Myxococcales bacterium]|nr:WD40 repeat domain-containing protein [Myxococcales bacterium]MDH3842497.1 WD40 repeat domain-containing protein [Myxococcales bacterium]
MNISRTTIPIALAGLMIASSVTVAAVTTQHFTIDSAESFSTGELEGTAVHSDGAVRLGASKKRTELENVPIAYSVAERGNVVYVGTGTSGMVYRFDKMKPTKKYATGELLVSSLAFATDGTLYAGTLPNGRIFKINPKSGKIEHFSKPEGAKHIWALHYDSKRRRLIAGTGPEGAIFSINPVGAAKILHKGDSSHVMSLAGDGKGTIYAGTSDSALVMKVASDDKVTVVHDFPGNEVTAIDYYDGQLAVAANEFKTQPGARFTAGAPAPVPAPSAAAAASRIGRPRPGKGQLWRVSNDGRVERLLDRQDTHFTAVEWGTDGAIFAGGATQGQVFRVEPDAKYAIWADVEERQVLGLSLRSKTPVFVTGDGASIYWVERGTPRKPVWTSDSLDTGFGSQWGRLTWRGRGKLTFQTRSGNTKEPDDTWSSWSKRLREPGRVGSPPGRFAQVRALFPTDASAELRAVELYYLPQNQRARVSSIAGTPPPPKPGAPAQRPPAPSTLLNLTWAVDNPDGDVLRYRLSYQQEGQPVWRPMFLEDRVVNEPKYTWDTGSIPDGYYVVRVEASDEEANPANLMLDSEAVSEPILIDNHPPRIEKLGYRNRRVEGRVVDSLGPIARIQASIDAGVWRDVFPKDLLLDSRSKEFELDLGALPGKSHIVAIRAFDAAGNQANQEITIKTRK